MTDAKPAIPNYLQRMIKSKERKRQVLVRASHASPSVAHRSKVYNGSHVFTQDPYSMQNNQSRFARRNKQSVQPVARYLQSLAHFGKWDEFAEALRQAQSQGFSPSSSSQAPRQYRKESFQSLQQVPEHSNEDVRKNDSTSSSVFKRMKCWKSFIVKLNQDVFQAVILMVSLEIPYFLARVTFTIVYNVSSTTMVFYTTKNMVMVIFLFYRLWVIWSGKNIEEQCEEEKQSVQRDAMNIK